MLTLVPAPPAPICNTHTHDIDRVLLEEEALNTYGICLEGAGGRVGSNAVL